MRFNLPVTTDEILECAEAAEFQMVSSQDYYVENPVKLEFLVPFSSVQEEAAADIVSRFSQALQGKALCTVS